jgi:hypothetical protein
MLSSERCRVDCVFGALLDAVHTKNQGLKEATAIYVAIAQSSRPVQLYRHYLVT